MSMKGKIIKGIAGFYYVHTEKGIFECKAKGVFRKEKVKPLVGDNVEIELLDEGNSAAEECLNPSGLCQHRSGACNLCNCEA